MRQMKNSSILTFRMVFLLSAFFGLAVVTDVTAQKKGLFEVTRVKLDKKSFNPSAGEMVTLSFEITTRADAEVFIYDRLGGQVRNFAMPGLEAGRHSITWDGRDADGKLGAGDVFLYVIEARTKDGRKVIYNRAGRTGGLQVKTLEYTLDSDTGEIEYVLPKACMIRIRAGLEDGMFGNLLLDWKPSTAGRHTHQWDGMDSTGRMNLLNHRDLDIRLTCHTLPDNTIIATGSTIPLKSHNNPGGSGNNSREQVWATKGKYLHYRHDPRICHQPRFKVLFPGSKKADDKGVPITSGITPLRIELDPRDAMHLINTRFEIMLFIDGVFIYEIEEGSSPFTFNWDTKGFAKGPHIITVNLIGYDDHIGIVSRRVIVGD